MCAPEADATGALNWEQHLNGNLDKFLEAKCELA